MEAWVATIFVKDSVGLVAALKSAHGGDVIQLMPGTYAPVAIQNLKFDTDVVIKSADANKMAVMNGLVIRGCEGLDIQGVEIVVDPSGGSFPFQISDSKDIEVRGVEVHGSEDGDHGNDVSGLQIRNSQDIEVSGSNFHDVHFGISHLDNDGLTITENYFHDIRTDGVRGGGSSNVEVSYNYFTNIYPQGRDHADAIQFWTGNIEKAGTNILVKGNVIVRGDGDATHGIFFRDEAGDMAYNGVTIEDNLIVGANLNAITVAGASNVKISNNTVAGLVDEESVIRIQDTTNVVMTNNQSTGYVLNENNQGLVQNGDTTIAKATDGGKLIQADWLAAHQPSGAWAIASDAGFVTDFTLSSTVNALNLSTAELDAAAKAAAENIQTTIGVIETVIGTSGADSLKVFSTQSTFIDAGAGNDNLYGGGIGHNTLSGGAGDDTYLVKTGLDRVVESSGGGIDNVTASVDFELPDFVESLRLVDAARYGAGNGLANKIVGSAGDDEIHGLGGDDALMGQDGADFLNGGMGADALNGGTGNDTLKGDSGSDKLLGNEGVDSISGGADNDTLEGGAGSDTLAGGSGADTFFFRQGDLNAAGDYILDYSRTDGDRISLSPIDANTNLTGDQKFAFIGNAGFSKVAGELRSDIKDGVTHVYGDANGDGVADVHLILPGAGLLTSADFSL